MESGSAMHQNGLLCEEADLGRLSFDRIRIAGQRDDFAIALSPQWGWLDGKLVHPMGLGPIAALNQSGVARVVDSKRQKEKTSPPLTLARSPRQTLSVNRICRLTG